MGIGDASGSCDLDECYAGEYKTADRLVCRLLKTRSKEGALLSGFSWCRNGRCLGARKHRMRAAGANVEDSQADRSDHEDDCRPGGEAGQHIRCGTGAKSGLRSLAAKRACEVSRTALLEEHNSDKKQAHEDVHGDDEVEKNLHFLSCFLTLARLVRRRIWCGGGDLNPYALWAPAPQAGASANFATSA